MLCGKEAQYRWNNYQISQSDYAAEIPRRYKNVVLYSPDPLSSWRVEGGSGDETTILHTVLAIYILHVCQTKNWGLGPQALWHPYNLSCDVPSCTCHTGRPANCISYITQIISAYNTWLYALLRISLFIVIAMLASSRLDIVNLWEIRSLVSLDWLPQQPKQCAPTVYGGVDWGVVNGALME